MWLFLITFVATGVGVANQIEPETPLPLAEVGRSEQTIDEPFVRIWCRVSFEFADFFVGRRKPDQVQIKPTDQRRPAGDRRGLHSQFLQTRLDEGIDGRL